VEARSFQEGWKRKKDRSNAKPRVTNISVKIAFSKYELWYLIT